MFNASNPHGDYKFHCIGGIVDKSVLSPLLVFFFGHLHQIQTLATNKATCFNFFAKGLTRCIIGRFI
ncbi:hypothetical protein Agabi119p4_9703 [Agaricus bisporus var. burnettii]|uniref:Uncharacterized protein n=1 Tax=Agaricus bisporus var. burnettii TaxID=192524 RepID=A0A8H7EX28_AGABI|nr:hypothetical protein Agabi119p4_9703 [Agaricus bisporus var. burnettii]